MQALKLVHPGQPASGITRVELDIRLKGSLLSALFKVRTARPMFVNAEMPLREPQWGLWDWDVVELFVCCSAQPSRLPYYEFELSPLGQYLELQIHEPRKQVDRDFRSGFTRVARKISDTEWEAELGIPLDRLGWNGDPATVTGNAFAVLGPPDAREYWSLFLGQQKKPDFHVPGAFKRLV